MTPSTGAADCSREAVLTTSPATIDSPMLGRAPSETRASPVLTAIRIWRSNRPAPLFCACTLAVRESVQALNNGDGRLDLQIRIAVNTGEALVSLGARPSMGESMVVGDVVNTASRLQQAAPVNGIVVGEETYLATRASIVYERAPSVVAKGKAAPLSVWLALNAATPSGERTMSETSLVGRTRELRVLQGIWDSVATERTPHLITIL